MKRFITICILVCAYSLNPLAAQDTILIRNSGDLKSANDSLRKLLQLLLVDSLAYETPVSIQLQSPTAPSAPASTAKVATASKTTEISLPDGANVTIISDETGTRQTLYRKPSKSKSRFYYRGYFDLGYNRADHSNIFSGNSDGSASDFPDLLNRKSVSVGIHSIVGIRITRNYFSMETGLGLEWFNFRFINDMTIKNVDGFSKGVSSFDVLDNVSKVAKTKLTASYLSIPLLLKLKIPANRNRFFLAAGMNVGVNLNYHTKIVYYDNNSDKHKYKDYDELHLSLLRYGFTARVGFGIAGFFAHYYMTPLFSKGKGPQVYPYVVGMTFTI